MHGIPRVVRSNKYASFISVWLLFDDRKRGMSCVSTELTSWFWYVKLVLSRDTVESSSDMFALLMNTSRIAVFRSMFCTDWPAVLANLISSGQSAEPFESNHSPKTNTLFWLTMWSSYAFTQPVGMSFTASMRMPSTPCESQVSTALRRYEFAQELSP